MINPKVQSTIDTIRQELQPTGTGVHVHAQTQTPLGIQDILEAIKDLGEHRDMVIKTILAVYVSTFLEQKDPIWMMIVGNPSSNKTTLVDLLKDLPDVYRLDTMTSNPFSSGQREKEKPKDLLPLLNGKCFINKEYGTLFGRSDEMVKQLISDLVAIYDGEYAKHSPTRGTIRYTTFFSHIGCVTPMAISQRQRYMNTIGARFLMFRVPILSQEEKKERLKSLWVKGNKKSKQEITGIMTQFCTQLKARVKEGIRVSFPDDIRSQIDNMASLMARARGIVITERTSFTTEDQGTKYHYEVSDKQVEEPFRAHKQLRKMAECLTLVNGREEVGQEELDIMRIITLSSMTVRRADVLRAFENKEQLTAKEAEKFIDKNYKTIKRNFDELQALEVLESRKEFNDKARVYYLKPEFQTILRPQMKQTELFSKPTESKPPGLTMQEVREVFPDARIIQKP